MRLHRLNLLVSAVFLMALILSLFGLIRQGKKDITREVGAGLHFAGQMVALASDQQAHLRTLLASDTRHIRFYLTPLPDVAAEPDEGPPRWFSDLLLPTQLLAEGPQAYSLDGGDTLYVVAAPEDEIDEVWESALALSLLFFSAMLLSCLAITWGVRQGLKPVTQLLEWLEQSSTGGFRTRLQQYPLPHANQLACHFGQMADALEQERQGNAQLTRQLMMLQESERGRLAHTLHDDLGQYLTGIRAQAFVITQVSERPEQVTETAQRIIQHCDEMQQSFRHLIRDLHPVILEQLGLGDALRNLAEQWQQTCSVQCHLQLPAPFPELNGDSASHLYRLVQEALNNVSRHARASEVSLVLAQQPGSLLLQLKDNGSGLNADSRPGVGMRSMHERARCLGSALQLDSVAGGGTTIRLEIPLESL